MFLGDHIDKILLYVEKLYYFDDSDIRERYTHKKCISFASAAGNFYCYDSVDLTYNKRIDLKLQVTKTEEGAFKVRKRSD